MGLADDFQVIVDSLSDDWTDLELELRIFDVDRYIEAATYVVVCNAIPLSKHEWHWRIIVAHCFGHAAPAHHPRPPPRPRGGRPGGAPDAQAARRLAHRGRAGAARRAHRAHAGHA